MRDLSTDIALRRKELHDQIENMTPRDVEYARVVVSEERIRQEPTAGNVMETSAKAMGGTRPSHEPIGLGNIDDVMAYQPWGPLETDRGTQVREALTAAAKAVLRCVPEGRYRDKAVDGLLQVRMDANAGISFRGRF